MKSLKSANLKLSFTLSTTTKWILTILILGLGVVLVVVFYAQEQTRNNDLEDEVDKAAATLVQNSLTRKDLDNRLILANLSLAELAAKFPSSEQSMDMEGALFKAAADAGVEITGINSTEPRDQKVGNSTYQAYGVSVTVTGDTESLLAFVGKLGYWLPSAEVQSASIVGETMSLALQVYTWGG